MKMVYIQSRNLYESQIYNIDEDGIDIHCTNLRECSIFNIDVHVQDRHLLYKPT